MLCLKIFTNLPRQFASTDFAQRIVAVLARILCKPEDKFIVMISADCMVPFFGEKDITPGVVATLESIGNLDIEEHQIITKEITTFMQNELAVAPENVFLTFYTEDITKGGHTMI